MLPRSLDRRLNALAAKGRDTFGVEDGQGHASTLTEQSAGLRQVAEAHIRDRRRKTGGREDCSHQLLAAQPSEPELRGAPNRTLRTSWDIMDIADISLRGGNTDPSVALPL